MSLKEQHDYKSKPKRKRSESPSSTTMSYEQTDLGEEPSGQYTNKRVRFERESSPSPSYLSLKSDWSIDLPTNFREAFPLDSRGMLERPASPVNSYLSLKTDWSMDLPANFKESEASHLETITGLKRPHSPTLSSVSEWTDCLVEQPTSFKAEATFNTRLLTENHLKCPVCKSMLKDPVSIPCGHNFCRDCINKFWDSCSEDYVCPECGRGSKIRPELNTNTALAEVVKNLQQAAFSPVLPPCSYAESEDVACDFCSERRLKAVKSCLTCDVLLCETHIRTHYTIPALQKHTLSDVTEAMGKKLSEQDVPADNQNHSDKTSNIKKPKQVMSSVVNAATIKTKRPKKAQRTARPKTRLSEENADFSRLQVMYSTLQQEVSGLKKSFSKFSKKKKTQKDKSYYEMEDDYREGEEDGTNDWEEDGSDEGKDDFNDWEEDGSDEGKEDSNDWEEDGSDEGKDDSNDWEEDGSDEGKDDSNDWEEDGFDEEEDNSYDDDEKEEGDSDDEEERDSYIDDEDNNSEDYDKDISERSDEEDKYENFDTNSLDEHSSKDEDNYSDYDIY